MNDAYDQCNAVIYGGMQCNVMQWCTCMSTNNNDKWRCMVHGHNHGAYDHECESTFDVSISRIVMRIVSVSYHNAPIHHVIMMALYLMLHTNMKMLFHTHSCWTITHQCTFFIYHTYVLTNIVLTARDTYRSKKAEVIIIIIIELYITCNDRKKQVQCVWLSCKLGAGWFYKSGEMLVHYNSATCALMVDEWW